jgi:hypothetical protein
LRHSFEVEVAGRRYRVILRGSEAIAVTVWIVEEFGPGTPHAYWRRVWITGGVRLAGWCGPRLRGHGSVRGSVCRRLAPQSCAPGRRRQPRYGRAAQPCLAGDAVLAAHAREHGAQRQLAPRHVRLVDLLHLVAALAFDAQEPRREGA